MGYDVKSISHADERVARASVMDVELGSGERLRVDAFGRDQRDARIAAKVWHQAMYHDPGVPVFGSRIQQVEHIGFTLMLAERADVHAARLVDTGVGGADAAVLVTTPPAGTPIASLPARAAHRRSARRRLATARPICTLPASHTATSTGCACSWTTTVRSRSTTSARPTPAGEQYWCNRDDAALLVLTAQLVGDERAIAAMVDTLGKERAGPRSFRWCNRRRCRRV